MFWTYVPGFWSAKGFRETVRALIACDVLEDVWCEEVWRREDRAMAGSC